jgi:alpha/beta superfamily hydrolase
MPSRLEKPFRLASGGGAATEGLVADQGSAVGVVVTHPWGPLGGNLHNNVVGAAVLYFQNFGLTTVRFDFASQLVSRGYTQLQQLHDVVDGLLTGRIFSKDDASSTRESLSSVKHVLLVGYSYGSLIAGSASADIPQCVATISIAPPWGVSHWLLAFNSKHHLQRAAERQQMPRMFLIGNRDNFTSVQQFQTTLEQRFPTVDSTGAVLKGADHFFAGREKDVMDCIGQWLLTTFHAQLQGDLKRLRDLDFGLTTSAVTAADDARPNASTT